MANLYLIGSLKRARVPLVAKQLRAAGHEVFDDWHGCGPEADRHWREYEQARGRNFIEALQGDLATHALEFDRINIEKRDTGVLCFPQGNQGILSCVTTSSHPASAGLSCWRANQRTGI